MEFVKESAKAIAGFVVGVVGVILQRLVTNESVLPSIVPFDTGGWITLVSIGVLGYLGIYATSNKLTAGQAVKGIPGLAEPARATVAKKALNSLPQSVRDHIIAHI